MWVRKPLADRAVTDNRLMSTEATSDTGAVVFLTVELPELLGIIDTAHAGALEALAAVLADGHVFDDLSPADANRVAETVAFEAIRCDWALAAAADAVTDRAIRPLARPRQRGVSVCFARERRIDVHWS
jgi:hypothetical protein